MNKKLDVKGIIFDYGGTLDTLGWSYRALPKYENVNQKEFVQLSYEALRNSYEFRAAVF